MHVYLCVHVCTCVPVCCMHVLVCVCPCVFKCGQVHVCLWCACIRRARGQPQVLILKSCLSCVLSKLSWFFSESIHSHNVCNVMHSGDLLPALLIACLLPSPVPFQIHDCWPCYETHWFNGGHLYNHWIEMIDWSLVWRGDHQCEHN